MYTCRARCLLSALSYLKETAASSDAPPRQLCAAVKQTPAGHPFSTLAVPSYPPSSTQHCCILLYCTAEPEHRSAAGMHKCWQPGFRPCCRRFPEADSRSDMNNPNLRAVHVQGLMRCGQRGQCLCMGEGRHHGIRLGSEGGQRPQSASWRRRRCQGGGGLGRGWCHGLHAHPPHSATIPLLRTLGNPIADTDTSACTVCRYDAFSRYRLS